MAAGLATVKGGFARTGEFEASGSPEADASPVAMATPGSGGSLVVYSGRNEGLVGPLIEQFQAQTGITVEVRYAGTSELAATILEEGDNSPADVFFAQDAGALGALQQEGRLAPIDQELLDRVDARFRSDEGVWVGASGRARVLVYNTEALAEADLPASVTELTDSAWSGRIGWAPTNASFQSFITAFRVLQGEDAARAWLEAMIANNPVPFESNGAATRAVAAGEIDAALVNHYYRFEVAAEEGTDLPLENHYFEDGDVGSLVNVAGVAQLTTAQNADQARTFIDYLLSQEAQEYFAQETFEYPLIEGVDTAEGVRPLSEVQSPEIDLSDLADLEATLELLAEVGLL